METINQVETAPVSHADTQSECDAFISYAHEDLGQVVRIQAFLEDYGLPGRRRKLRILRDKTDLTGGELRRSLPSEIRVTRVLLLCCSAAAALSKWVALEIAEFDAAHGERGTIVPLLLSGQPADVLAAALAGRDTLVLDLREGWRFGRPRNATRVELLRALAPLANIGLRELIPWDALRLRRHRFMVAGLTLAGLAAVGTAGVEAWRTVTSLRDADAATVRLNAGDIPGGVAALGHALARDSHGLLTGRLEVLCHWLGVLPLAHKTATAGGPLVRVNRQTYLRVARDHFAPLVMREPYVAVRDRHDGLVTASPREIVYFSARDANALARVLLPSGSKIASIRASRDGRALVVLTTMRVALDVPRLSSGVDVVRLDLSGWDETMNAAWQKVDSIAVTKLPAVTSEHALWRDFGEARSDPVPLRVGLVSTMDDAAYGALGTSEVEGNAGIAYDSFARGGFSDGKRRVFWGSYVSGNSQFSVARCVAPEAGKVTACASKFEYIVMEAQSEAPADGRKYAVSSQHPAASPLIVYDLASDAVREQDKQPLAPVQTIAFTADSSRLAVLTSVGEVSSYRFDADGTPRLERSIGTHDGELDVRRNQYAPRAMRGTLMPAVNARADIAVSADGERVLVYAGETAVLFQASSGPRLSAPFDQRTLLSTWDGSTPLGSMP